MGTDPQVPSARIADALRVDLRARFEQYRGLAERALAQVDDRAFFAAPDDETNPLALQVKHLAGNFRSRWSDFLTSDGEKPDRQRDREFVLEDGDTHEALMARWADGWQRLFATLDALGPDDWTRTVTIRGEMHTVTDALLRGLAHAAYHVGQIVLLAKHHAGAGWQTLSVPRGESETYTAAHRVRHTA